MLIFFGFFKQDLMQTEFQYIQYIVIDVHYIMLFDIAYTVHPVVPLLANTVQVSDGHQACRDCRATLPQPVLCPTPQESYHSGDHCLPGAYGLCNSMDLFFMTCALVATTVVSETVHEKSRYSAENSNREKTSSNRCAGVSVRSGCTVINNCSDDTPVHRQIY